jgi:hypothetical protein
MAAPPTYESLDFIYQPSRDAKRDLAYFVEVLGGRPRFAIEGMGTRVAAIDLTGQPPLLLLAEHLTGETPVLVYRVPDLFQATEQLKASGWQPGESLEIPPGPVCSFRAPGGQRMAIYQLTRPEAAAHFEGRRDL